MAVRLGHLFCSKTVVGYCSSLLTMSHNTYFFLLSSTSQLCPFTRTSLPSSFPFSPPFTLLLISFLFLLSVPVFDVARPPQVLVTSPAQRKVISQPCEIWTWNLPMGWWRYRGTDSALAAPKPVLRQEYTMILPRELASSLQTRVSENNSVPHSLSTPTPQPLSRSWPPWFSPRPARQGAHYIPIPTSLLQICHLPNQEKSIYFKPVALWARFQSISWNK